MRAPIPAELCGLVTAATVLGDKAALLVLREAFYGVTRFDAMQADLAMPRQTLSRALQRLTANGLLARRTYRVERQRERIEYILTPLGTDLAVALIALMQWGDRHFSGSSPAAILLDRGSGLRVEARLVSEDGTILGIGDVQIERIDTPGVDR